MAFIVVYDANVLYPNTLRDLLIRISQAGLVQAKWINEILERRKRQEEHANQCNCPAQEKPNTEIFACQVTAESEKAQRYDAQDTKQRVGVVVGPFEQPE